jgi:hypothetical protein
VFGECFSGRTYRRPSYADGILSPAGGRSLTMETILRLLCPRGDSRVQSLIEYVLLAGFVAAAAAAFFPIATCGFSGTVFTR